MRKGKGEEKHRENEREAMKGQPFLLFSVAHLLSLFINRFLRFQPAVRSSGAYRFRGVYTRYIERQERDKREIQREIQRRKREKRERREKRRGKWTTSRVISETNYYQQLLEII